MDELEPTAGSSSKDPHSFYSTGTGLDREDCKLYIIPLSTRYYHLTRLNIVGSSSLGHAQDVHGLPPVGVAPLHSASFAGVGFGFGEFNN